MSRIEWGTPGQRFYEVGIDRGVLYVDDNPGVPWNGLVAVNPSPTGGEEKPYYLDGVKRLSRSAPEEFEAALEAYTYPEEFAQCDGSRNVANGLFATQQVRKGFNLAYRTLVGNDVKGNEAGYKIHLLYNARVAPSSKTYSTLSDDTSPDNFSWRITATSTNMEGVRPTPYFVVDSRYTPRALMRDLEEILYGTEDEDARMPRVHELHYIFTSYSVSVFDAGDPTEESYNTFDAGVVGVDAQTSTIDGGVA